MNSTVTSTPAISWPHLWIHFFLVWHADFSVILPIVSLMAWHSFHLREKQLTAERTVLLWLLTVTVWQQSVTFPRIAFHVVLPIPEFVCTQWTLHFPSWNQLDAYPLPTKPPLFADAGEKGLSVWSSLYPSLGDVISSLPSVCRSPYSPVPCT